MGIDGVDDEGFDACEIIVGESAGEDDDFGGKYGRAVFSGENLDALGGGIRALVELAGQVLDGEGGLVFPSERDAEMSSTCGSERMWVAAS